MIIDIYNPYTIRIVGGVIVGLLLLIFRYGIKHFRNYLMQKKNRLKQKTVSKEQEPKKKQESLTENTVFDKHITPTKILKKLQKTPPLQRKNIAQSYKGIKVSWRVRFRGIDADKNENTHMSMFSFSSRTYVSCHINLDDYPKLNVINEEYPLIIQGVIESVNYEDRRINLTMCKLRF